MKPIGRNAKHDGGVADGQTPIAYTIKGEFYV